MPFALIKHKAEVGKKINLTLFQDLGYTISTSQRLLSKKRVFDNNQNPYTNGNLVSHCDVFVAEFVPKSRGLKPLIDTKEFAIFDKPTGVMIHPTSKYTEYCLLDEIRYHFGDEANPTHRIDKETLGLVLVSKNKKSEQTLKNMFMDKQIYKSYMAIVENEVKNEIEITSKIGKCQNTTIGVKMCVSNSNIMQDEKAKFKDAYTKIFPLSYNKEKNQTMVQVEIKTGRQHQIRVHLDSIGHKIVGDPIYGVDENIADDYLNKKLSDEDRILHTKSQNLQLHAHKLVFDYKNRKYIVYSQRKLQF